MRELHPVRDPMTSPVRDGILGHDGSPSRAKLLPGRGTGLATIRAARRTMHNTMMVRYRDTQAGHAPALS